MQGLFLHFNIPYWAFNIQHAVSAFINSVNPINAINLLTYQLVNVLTGQPAFPFLILPS